MTEQKEMHRMQREITDLKKMVKNLKEENYDYIEEIERKEMFIHELKKKSPPECTYGCSKYNKSVDEIVNAGHKHREKLLAIKDIAEDQKEKIRLLRNQKSQLENRIDKLTDELEMEQKYVQTIQKDSANKIKKLKDELKAAEELKKSEEREKAVNNNESVLKNNITELNNFVEKQQLELGIKEEQIKELSGKVEFLKPKFESSLKENQSLTASLDNEKKKSTQTSNIVETLEEKLAGLETVVSEMDAIALKNQDLEDEVIQKQNELELLKNASEEGLDKVLHKSASSLADELETAMNKKKDVDILELEKKIFEEKLKLSSGLFKLGEKEHHERQYCRCKNYCNISHKKHNWKKSLVVELQVEFGFLLIDYECNECGDKFDSKESLKKHAKINHTIIG